MFPLRRFTIREDSMLPVLKTGDDVLIFKFQKGKVGDMVVARVNDKILIKRVKNIEGDLYYLLSDNLAGSTDSRHFGPVDKRDILGKVIFIARD